MINYSTETRPNIIDIINLYNDAGLNRPTSDTERIEKMYQNSNLIVTAWDEDKLVGVARSVTDFCYCCYLSDLAVAEHYKRQGIGAQLVTLTKEKVGNGSNLLLLSAPGAMLYYPKIKMDRVDNGFIIKRIY